MQWRSVGALITNIRYTRPRLTCSDLPVPDYRYMLRRKHRAVARNHHALWVPASALPVKMNSYMCGAVRHSRQSFVRRSKHSPTQLLSFLQPACYSNEPRVQTGCAQQTYRGRHFVEAQSVNTFPLVHPRSFFPPLPIPTLVVLRHMAH